MSEVNFVVRTISIPVAEVLEGGSKVEFKKSLESSLAVCRKIANLAQTACIAQDDFSLKSPPKICPYSAAKGLTHSNIASPICRDVLKRYKQLRFKITEGRASAPSYRSMPQPLLSNKGNTTFRLFDEGQFLTARLLVGREYWVVRLAGGSNYRDQIAGLRQAIKSASVRDSRVDIDRKGNQILQICIRCPIEKHRNLKGTLRVSSALDSMLVMSKERSKVPFVINADDVRRWKAEANKRQQRIRQDKKAGVNRRRLREESRDASLKMSRRLKAKCHEFSSVVVQKAIALRAASIELDLTVRSYLPEFPWFDLAAKISEKCERAGIEFKSVTGTTEKADVFQPHVYFKLSPATGHVKIGHTTKSDGSRHKQATDSADELLILSIESSHKSKTLQREKHFHALFAEHRVRAKHEWFFGEPIVAWLVGLEMPATSRRSRKSLT